MIGAGDLTSILDRCRLARQALDDLLEDVDEDAVDHSLAVRLLQQIRAIEILVEGAATAPSPAAAEVTQ